MALHLHVAVHRSGSTPGDGEVGLAAFDGPNPSSPPRLRRRPNRRKRPKCSRRTLKFPCNSLRWTIALGRPRRPQAGPVHFHGEHPGGQSHAGQQPRQGRSRRSTAGARTRWKTFDTLRPTRADPTRRSPKDMEEQQSQGRGQAAGKERAQTRRAGLGQGRCRTPRWISEQEKRGRGRGPGVRPAKYKSREPRRGPSSGIDRG
jgi:hypothetical protein